jgi:hypothetical protein
VEWRKRAVGALGPEQFERFGLRGGREREHREVGNWSARRDLREDDVLEFFFGCGRARFFALGGL